MYLNSNENVHSRQYNRQIYWLPGNVCAKKWKDLVDTFRRKVDKSGSAGVPLSDKVLQWRFWDRMSFLKEYIVNRK